MPKGIPKNGINKGWFKRKERKTFTCKTCKCDFVDYKKRVFCSKKCLLEWRAGRPSWNKGLPAPWAKKSLNLFKKGQIPWDKGIKRPEITGENHPMWKGGKEAYPRCSVCGKLKNKYKNKTGKCLQCYLKQAIGKDAPHWKGGINSVIKRRATLAGADGFHSQKQWEALKKKYNYMCLCCKQFEPLIKLTEDHIVPLSFGGTNYISNIQPLCGSCNSIKHTKTLNFIKEYEQAAQRTD